MTQQSRISWNINGAGLPHPDVLEKHLIALQPRWALVMDNTGLAVDYAHKLPRTNVIARNWMLTQGDENVYSKLSPSAWLSARAGEATDGLWLYTANEAGINVKWDIELMKLVISRGLKNVKLVLGNPSVGTPSIESWSEPDRREWFQLLDAHRDQFVLGLHSYMAGIGPSGFIGGYPDGSWSDGRTGLHPNYENRANWPVDASYIGALWHCGRFMAVNVAARGFGYMPPRIVITEHGLDDLGDLKPWLSKFAPSNGALNIGGWKTCTHLWERLLPGRTNEQAYFENVSYLDGAVYQHFPNVEGQLLFTWSSSPRWAQFDGSEATVFQGLLETYAGVVQVPPIIIPPVIVPPVPNQLLTAAQIQQMVDSVGAIKTTLLQNEIALRATMAADAQNHATDLLATYADLDKVTKVLKDALKV